METAESKALEIPAALLCFDPSSRQHPAVALRPAKKKNMTSNTSSDSSLSFISCPALVGELEKWTRSNLIQLRNGFFSALLEDTGPLPPTLFDFSVESQEESTHPCSA